MFSIECQILEKLTKLADENQRIGSVRSKPRLLQKDNSINFLTTTTLPKLAKNQSVTTLGTKRKEEATFWLNKCLFKLRAIRKVRGKNEKKLFRRKAEIASIIGMARNRGISRKMMELGTNTSKLVKTSAQSGRIKDKI